MLFNKQTKFIKKFKNDNKRVNGPKKKKNNKKKKKKKKRENMAIKSENQTINQSNIFFSQFCVNAIQNGDCVRFNQVDLKIHSLFAELQ